MWWGGGGGRVKDCGGGGGGGRWENGPSTVLCSFSFQDKFNVGSSSGLQLLSVISGNQYLLLGGALVFCYLVRVDTHTHTRTHARTHAHTHTHTHTVKA